MTTNNNTGLKVIIGILVALLAILSYFTYKNHEESVKTEETLLEQKLELQEDLDARIVELDNEIARSTTLKDELIDARDNILQLKESVKDLKTLNSNIIRRYKKQLADLEDINKSLMLKSQQLAQDNYNLSVEVDSTKAEVVKRDITIEKKIKENADLSSKNENLSTTISKGSVLQVSDVTVSALKERWGKLKETQRARKVNALRIGYKIRKNTIAKSGTKTTHIVIKDASGKTVTGVDSFNTDDGESIVYSEVTNVEYENEDKEVVAVIDIPEKSLEKGNYYIDIYMDNKFVAKASISLK